MSVVHATKNYVQDPAFRNFNWAGDALSSKGPSYSGLIDGSEVWRIGVGVVSADFSSTKGTMTDTDRDAVQGRGVTNYLRVEEDSPVLTTGIVYISQRIPIAQLLGFNNPVSYQWSTWVRSQYTRMVGLSAILDYGTGGSPSDSEVVCTPSSKQVQSGEWTRLTLDILLGDYLSKTLGSNMDAYLEVRVYLHHLTTPTETMPHIVDWSTVGGYTDLTASQLEAGVTTTIFEEEGPFFSEAFSARTLRVYAAPTHPADVINLEFLTGGGPAPIEFELLKFDISPTAAADEEGELVWNPTDNTLDMWLSPNVTLQIGQETVIKVKNETASQIDNGKAVALIGAAASGRPSVELADISTRTRAWATIGIATENIAAGGEGFVTVQGLVRGIDTSGLAAGGSVFLNGVPGNLTNIPPAPPNSVVHVAVCMVSDASNGVLYVPTVNIIGTVEELTDTTLTTPATGDLLVYDAGTKIWSNSKSLTTLAVTTGAVVGSATRFSTFHVEHGVVASSVHTEGLRIRNSDSGASWMMTAGVPSDDTSFGIKQVSVDTFWLVIDSTTGNVGLNTETPGFQLTVFGDAFIRDKTIIGPDSTAAYETFATDALSVYATGTYGSTSKAAAHIEGRNTYSSGAGSATTVAAFLKARHLGSATMSGSDGLIGGYLWAENASTATGTHAGAVVGGYSRADISSAAGNGTTSSLIAHRLRIANNKSGHTVTNGYALYISSAVATGTISNRWAIYQASTSDHNYFAGQVRIGDTDTVTSGRTLEVSRSVAANATFVYNVYSVVRVKPTATNTASTYSGVFAAYTDLAFNFTGSVYGILAQSIHDGTGTLSNAYGIRSEALILSGAGPITNAYAGSFRIRSEGTGGMTVANAIRIVTPSTTGGTIATYAGIYIEAGAGTTKYGVYQAGANDLNYFTGVTLYEGTRAEVYIQDGSQAAGITASSTWSVLSAGYTTGLSKDATVATTGITLTRAGTYLVQWQTSFSGGNSDEIEGAVAVNGTTQGQTESRRKLGVGGDVGSFSGGGLVTISANDVVRMAYQNLTDTDDITITHLQLTCVRVGH